MNTHTILTVSQLNMMLKSLIEDTSVLRNFTVRGEISNLTFNRSGHIYFSLKDDKASIKCMIWKSNAQKISELKLKDGMEVTCFGRLTYYILGGSLGFEVNQITLEGLGELQQLYQKRFQQLQKSGWFEDSLKKELPKFPKNIGLVTADTGAVIHDLIATISRRFPLATVYLFPTQVQGAYAIKDIANKINQANSFDVPLDVLVVARGGGSYEDLWSFNEMEVLNAIRNSKIPTVSAIGHEPDFTLSDYVADKRAATPTAAAELITPSLIELKADLKRQFNDWVKLMQELFVKNEQWLKQVNYFWANHMNQVLNQKMLILKSLYQANKERMKLQLVLRTNVLEQLEMQLKLASPFDILNRGYALIYDQKQQLILDIKDLKFGEKINLKTKQGTIEAQVRRVLIEGE